MFSKSNKEQIKAVTATQGKNPRMGRSSVPSIISADLSVKGMLVSTGDVQIDGHVEGDVRAVSLVIGDKAEIHGEIYAEDVTIRGKVIGRIGNSGNTYGTHLHLEVRKNDRPTDPAAFLYGKKRGKPAVSPAWTSSRVAKLSDL